MEETNNQLGAPQVCTGLAWVRPAKLIHLGSLTERALRGGLSHPLPAQELREGSGHGPTSSEPGDAQDAGRSLTVPALSAEG